MRQVLGGVVSISIPLLMGENRVQQKQQQKERERMREERKAQGLSEEQIATLETDEDARAHELALKTSSGNALDDLEVCNRKRMFSYVDAKPSVPLFQLRRRIWKGWH